MGTSDSRAVWWGAGALAGALVPLIWVISSLLDWDASWKSLGVAVAVLLALWGGLVALLRVEWWDDLLPWGVVLFVPVIATAATALGSPYSPRTRATTAVLLGAALSLMVARAWSRRSLRIVVALAVLAVGLLVANVGRAVLDEERLATARSQAQEANAELVTLAQTADASLKGKIDEAKKAFGAARAIPLTAEACADPKTAGLNLALCTSLDRAAKLLGMLPGTESTPPAPAGLPEVEAEPPQGDVDDRAERRRAARKATADRLADVETKRADALKPLSEMQKEIGDELERLTADLSTTSPGLARAALVRAAIGAVRGALDAYKARSSADTALGTAAGSVKLLCLAAGGEIQERENGIFGCAPDGPGEPQRELVIVAAQAERDVAASAALVSASEPDNKRLTKGDNNLSAAIAVRQQPAESAELTTVLGAGGASLAQAVPGLGGDRVPVALSIIGWLVVAALALAWYRWLEVTNARRGVALVKITELSGDTDKALYPEFRRHLIANVSEPGAVPGGQALTTVATLLEASSDPASKLLAPIFKVMQGITSPQPGYVVDATYSRPPASTAGPPAAPAVAPAGQAPATASPSSAAVPADPPAAKHEVLVRITAASNGSTLATHTVREANSHVALRTAGYWAAGWILERDTTSPSWASWTAASARALAAYEAAAAEEGIGPLDELRECAHLAPTSGLVLTRLAQAYDLRGMHLHALELYLRAATRHPRYPIACYRVGLSLSLVAAKVEAQWLIPSAVGIDTRRRVLESISRCGERMGLNKGELNEVIEDLRPDDVSAQLAREKLCEAGLLFLSATTKLLGRGRVATNSLRRSERRYWLPFVTHLGSAGRRQRFWETADSAKLAVARRGGLPVEPTSLSRYTQAAADAETSWQVLYNLACHDAIAAADPPSPIGRRTAILLLEQALEHDDAGQLKQAWLDVDPDLEALAGEHRFVALRDKLSGTTRSNEESGS